MKMTKRQKKLIDQYGKSDFFDIDDCFLHCSVEKRGFQEYIDFEMGEDDGWGYRILSFSKRGFVAGYKFLAPYEDSIYVYLKIYHSSGFPLIEAIRLEFYK